jgi:sugar fermentation stimulation protein A
MRKPTDCGCYIVVLFLDNDKTIRIGALGAISFKRGFYCYAGSALKNLSRRIERHKSLQKRNHWHFDYLRAHCEWVNAYPIPSPCDLECKVAHGLKDISDSSIPLFGCSDCLCDSHLFYFTEPSEKEPVLKKLIMKFRGTGPDQPSLSRKDFRL